MKCNLFRNEGGIFASTITLVLASLFHALTSNAIASVARSSKTAFVIGQHQDFAPEANSLAETLAGRGYDVRWRFSPDAAINAAEVLNELQATASRARPGDQIVISLQCHGWNSSDPTPNPRLWHNHMCCLNADCSSRITTPDLIRASRAFLSAGAKVAVMDNSCTGGATVLALESQAPEACAISTTSALGPSLTSFPAFSGAVRRPDIRTMQDLARWGELEILRNSAERMFQRAYISGCASGDAMAFRDRVSMAGLSLGDWELQGTSLYGILHPEDARPATRTYGEVYSRSCRMVSAFDDDLPGLLREFQRIASEVEFAERYRRALPSLMAEYQAAAIPWPVAGNDPQNLFAEIRAKSLVIRTLHEMIDHALSDLNLAVADLSAPIPAVALQPRMPTMALLPQQNANLIQLARLNRISDLRRHALSLFERVRAQNAEMSRLLNILEDVHCSARANPCRDFVL